MSCASTLGAIIFNGIFMGMKKIHLTIGHTGLLDAAPLLIARERGFFEAEGLSVSLSCELGLATVFSKLAEARLDGACMPVHKPLLLSSGAGVPRVSMQAAVITSYQGTGIVVTKAKSASRAGGAGLRIGVIAQGSSAGLFLHRYQQLNRAGVLADATLVPVVASQFLDFFRDGMFDGFCGNDPLPSLAALRSDVVCVANSADLFPMHPGSVATLRTEVVERNPEVAAAWARAVRRGCDECAQPAHQAEVWRLVFAQEPYMELDAQSRKALSRGPGENGPAGSSIRFKTTVNEATRVTDPVGFIDAAGRSALGTSLRGFDLKAEIARAYLLETPRVAARVR